MQLQVKLALITRGPLSWSCHALGYASGSCFLDTRKHRPPGKCNQITAGCCNTPLCSLSVQEPQAGPTQLPAAAPTWLPLVSLPLFAILKMPAPVCRNSGCSSSSNLPPYILSPPLPVPVGSPPWIMKSRMIRWNCRWQHQQHVWAGEAASVPGLHGSCDRRSSTKKTCWGPR
jgi:hypothetical protein